MSDVATMSSTNLSIAWRASRAFDATFGNLKVGSTIAIVFSLTYILFRALTTMLSDNSSAG